MNGVNELCFDPYSPVRRSEAAQVIFNMSGEEKPEFKLLFDDVTEKDWFKDAVIWCIDKEIMSEISKNKFIPEKYVTREELICALYRYNNLPETEENPIDNFYDCESISADATDAFNWAINEGILLGDDKNCLNPQKNLTRAELAAILVRIK